MKRAYVPRPHRRTATTTTKSGRVAKAARIEWEQQRLKERRELLDAIKLASGCSVCSYNTHPAALEFDHIDRTDKKFNVGASIMMNIARVLAEIKKCRVLCANCHRIKTSTSGEFMRTTRLTTKQTRLF